MQKSLDFFEQILYDNQADLQIQPAQSKYDPLAQSVEHLTFNQGVRSLEVVVYQRFQGFFHFYFNAPDSVSHLL